MGLTYTELLNETIKIYLAGNYEKAYSYITSHYSEVIGNLAQIFNFRYAIASKMGKKELALKLMKEAIIDHKFWYATEYLKSDNDLDTIREENNFQSLFEICKQREIEAQNESEGRIELISSKGLYDDKNQLIIALHGNQESNKISKYYWKNVINDERLVALFQSSEIEFSDAYNWNDLDQGMKVFNILKNKLGSEISSTVENTILAGFSAGGRQILHYSLFTEEKVKGLILLAPWLPELDAWSEKLKILKNKKTKVYIICGDQDEDSYADSKKLDQLLDKYQIAHQFTVIKNLVHDYPKDFSKVIDKSIQYINS